MNKRIPSLDIFINEVNTLGNINAYGTAVVFDDRGKELAYIADTPNSVALFIQENPDAYEIKFKSYFYNRGDAYKVITKTNKDLWKELSIRSLSDDQKLSLRKNWKKVNRS